MIPTNLKGMLNLRFKIQFLEHSHKQLAFDFYLENFTFSILYNNEINISHNFSISNNKKKIQYAITFK